jgi:hypothetical protein
LPVVAEQALLHQQLIILQRRVKRPRRTPADRLLLVLPATPTTPMRSSTTVDRAGS